MGIADAIFWAVAAVNAAYILTLQSIVRRVFLQRILEPNEVTTWRKRMGMPRSATRL